MRKDIKKRLERALITLQEPGGSTIRAIVKVINHDSPFLSLRKVLEALQEGINEGFLYMYNGRIKLSQQLTSGKDKNVMDDSEIARKEKMKKDTTPNRNFPENESNDELQEEDEEEEENDEDEEDDDDDDDDEDNKITFTLAKDVQLLSDSLMNNKAEHTVKPRRRISKCFKNIIKTRGKRQKSQRKTRTAAKKPARKPGRRKTYKKPLKPREPKNSECLLLVDSSSTIPEAKSSKPTSEKPDMKRQRGPRCTSMKKDVRMPSKVHIPFVSPSVPQKGVNFNDLIRRSPDPVNGPLFDDYRLGLGFFESFC